MRQKIPLLDIFRTLDEKQRRILIGVIAFLLVFFICYRIIYKNAAKKVVYYQSEFKKVTAQNELREELHGLDGVKEGYEALIIQRRDIDGFKNELSKLALDSGAKVVSITSARRPGPAGYNLFSTTLELRCGYHQLGNLLSRIENAEPYIGIRSIRLGTAEARRRGFEIDEPLPEGDAFANVSLVLETYSLGK